MKNTPLLTASTAALCAFTLLPAVAHAQAPQYTVTVLDNLVGGTMSNAYGINASGQVAGWSGTSGASGPHAVRWTGTTPAALGTAAGTNTYGYGINAAGQVAGYADNGPAVRWTGTVPTNLGTLGGSSFGIAINDSGQVAGTSTVPNPRNDFSYHAVRWTGTTPTDLGFLPGVGAYRTSNGTGINTSGQVSGFSSITGIGDFHAARWTDTTPEDLGTLGGTISQGNGINDSGQVVGDADVTGNAGHHAVLWTGTTPTDLGTLGGSTSFGYGVNDSGDIIGVPHRCSARDQTTRRRQAGAVSQTASLRHGFFGPFHVCPDIPGNVGPERNHIAMILGGRVRTQIWVLAALREGNERNMLMFSEKQRGLPRTRED